MVKFSVMFIDCIEGSYDQRDIKGMRSKVKNLKQNLELQGLITDFAVSQNKEKGHEYFSCDFYTDDKKIKKAFKCCKLAGAYNIRTSWHSEED